MGGYKEVERKDGRILKSGKEGSEDKNSGKKVWEDIDKWKGSMGGRGYREVERKDGRI